MLIRKAMNPTALKPTYNLLGAAPMLTLGRQTARKFHRPVRSCLTVRALPITFVAFFVHVELVFAAGSGVHNTTDIKHADAFYPQQNDVAFQGLVCPFLHFRPLLFVATNCRYVEPLKHGSNIRPLVFVWFTCIVPMLIHADCRTGGISLSPSRSRPGRSTTNIAARF